MDQGQRNFYQRLRSLDRQHLAMTRGYSTHIRPDGLIVARPRPIRPRLWLKPLLFGAVGFFLFKAFLIAGLGAATFDERLARLDSGTVVERAGAVVMRPDCVSGFLAGHIAPYLP
jgi:hypothetical protein